MKVMYTITNKFLKIKIKYIQMSIIFKTIISFI